MKECFNWKNQFFLFVKQYILYMYVYVCSCTKSVGRSCFNRLKHSKHIENDLYNF